MEESKPSLYPKIIDLNSPFLSSSSSSNPSLYPFLNDPNPNSNPDPNLTPPSSSILYPSIEMKDLVDSLFPDNPNPSPNLPPPVQETLVSIPASILHLIDKQSSVELASGDFLITRISQSDDAVAVLAQIGDVQWPLARDESHYFFSLHDPSDHGLTFATKGQEQLLKQLDEVLESCCTFSKEKVNVGGEVLGGSGRRRRSWRRDRLRIGRRWLAPNVEDYSGSVARAIAKGSGKVIQGIL